MWYQRKTGDGSIRYTPFRKMGARYVPFTENTTPTPQEVAKYLNENPDAEVIKSLGLAAYEMELGDDGIDLPIGVYRYIRGNYDNPSHLLQTEIRNDTYIDLIGTTDKLIADINEFLKNEPLYRDLGTMYKKGYLFYGPPGTGKSSFIRKLLHHDLIKDAVIIFLEQIPETDFLEKLNSTLSHRLKIFIFEELASVVTPSSLDKALTFFDGEQTPDRSIMIATTNYPENLPGNIVDRESRFDLVMEIPTPNAEQRKTLLEHFLKASVQQEVIDETKGFSVAAIKELGLRSRLKQKDPLEFIKDMKKHKALVKKAFAKTEPIGLNRHPFLDDL